MSDLPTNIIIPDDVLRSIRGRLAAKRGERAELLTLKLLRRDGWSAARTRKGPVDVFAARNGNILLIQVKAGKARVKDKELKQLIKFSEDFNGTSEIWYFLGKGRLRRHSVRRRNV